MLSDQVLVLVIDLKPAGPSYARAYSLPIL